MQTNYSSFKQGDLVIVDMHFSNLGESKVRPALVISSTEYNQRGQDIIVLKITSNVKPRPFSVLLSQRDLASGSLKLESAIRADFPIAVEKSRITAKIAAVKPEVITEVKRNLKRVLEI